MRNPNRADRRKLLEEGLQFDMNGPEHMVLAFVGFCWKPLVSQDVASEVRHHKADMSPADVDSN
jgi:hypothetical protein